MNSKHYLVMSGIVGGVIGSLLTALLVSPVTAQRDKFGEIECTGLRVVDDAGNARIILTTDYRDAARRPYYDYDEVNVLITATGRGSLHVSGEEGKNGSVSIFSGSRSGSIHVYDDSGESMVSLGGRSMALARLLAKQLEKQGEAVPPDYRELKGYVEVYSKGNANGTFQAFPHGASVYLRYNGKDAYEVGGGGANLFGGQDTGGILELDYDIPFEKNVQLSQLDLGVNEKGGYVGIKSKKGKGRVAIGINEYGNGEVITRDKHGNRQ
ncbi:MAG: hypothetical protein OXP71_04765 [Candidatus Poribacteria bacterium]|nr:hypothetical protein [Candidatus Poribacteria bacterium]